MSVCDVPEPDERFSMDEFSELLNVTRPVIYVSVSELINTHKVRHGPGLTRSPSRPVLFWSIIMVYLSICRQLLLEHQETLCPDSSDPLRLLLQDLGSVPTLQDLTGIAPPLKCTWFSFCCTRFYTCTLYLRSVRFCFFLLWFTKSC